MHTETMEFVISNRNLVKGHVLEIGGMNVNGSIRQILSGQTESWHCIDIAPGPEVDEVADASVWEPSRLYDTVLCLEVFEHAERWPQILSTVLLSMRQGAAAICTWACHPREPHGAYGAHRPAPGEWYHNVEPWRVARLVEFHSAEYRLDVLPRGDGRLVFFA